MRVLQAIETQQIRWFDLGVSSPTPSFEWAENFVSVFPFFGADEHHRHQVWSVDYALYRCWDKMVLGEADVPKEWAKKKQQFQDVTAVLKAIVTGTDAASDWEAKRMKAFATEEMHTSAKLATKRP